jgi:outer membrane lipopolysaccharide assembly protein LptE/RlpB
MRRTLAALVLAAALLAGCGYRPAGRGDALPKSIRTIAIPAFANATMRYKLTESLPAAITREFLARTRYRVVEDAGSADAVLQGDLTRYVANPTTLDPSTGRASAAQLSVFLDITLRERATGTILFSRKGLELRERYEVSIDPQAYFDESGPALDRLTQDLARTIVSAVLEKF